MAYVIDDRNTIVPDEYHYPAGYLLVKRVVSFLVNLLELFLALRLVFKAFAAGGTAGFIRFIYALTEPFVAPFHGIFPVFRSENITIEWSTVMAMIIYALAVVLLMEFLRIFTLNYRRG